MMNENQNTGNRRQNKTTSHFSSVSRLLSSVFLFIIPQPAIGISSVWQPATPTPSLTATRDQLAQVFLDLYAKVINSLDDIIIGTIVFAIFFAAAMIGQRVIAHAAPRVRADTGVVLLLSRVYYYGILTFGLLTALQAAGLDVTALVAGLGLTGFALGFALKDVLSNLLSGIMLLIYRPFNIGDQIEMGAYEGTIQTIRMRDTVVRAYDGRLIIIPNTKLITEVVINNTAVRLLRESVSFAIATDADVEVAKEIFVRAMLNHVTIRGRVEPLIIVRQHDPRTTHLEGRFWYDPRRTDKATVRDEVSEAVSKAFAEAGLHATILPPAPPEQMIKAVEKEGPEEADRLPHRLPESVDQ